MKKDLIERLLNEQTTPDEEHLVAQMLQQGEDMEQWAPPVAMGYSRSYRGIDCCRNYCALAQRTGWRHHRCNEDGKA